MDPGRLEGGTLIPRPDAGFTILEVVVALFLIAVGVIATAPLFVFAAEENASGGDLGTIGALATQQLERLRVSPYGALATGGDLGSNVGGFHDVSNPGFVVRWTVTDNLALVPSKIIAVRVITTGPLGGDMSPVTVSALRGGE